MTEQIPTVDMEKLVSLCRRRGFIFPSSEIYGGLSSCWDYGPLGVELKRNIKQAWWQAVVQERDDMVGMDTSILMHPQVWATSGHLEGFADSLVECKSCHQRWKADDLAGDRCPSCDGELTESRQFNLMFKTFMGPVEDETSTVYLRPETAQGMFVNFKNVLDARKCSDIDYLFPMGWAELEGIANRGDFDLTQHAEQSGKSLEYFDNETKEHFLPYIIEPAAGVDRSVLAFLCDAYDEETVKGEKRVLLHLHPTLAPFKVAILPLSRREQLVAVAKEIHADLRQCWMVSYDDTQSIGRRYRRQDETGTPFCVTVDFQSLEDNQVTIRERDTLNQIRIPISELRNTLQAKLAGEDFFVLPPGGKIWKEGGKDRQK